MRREEKRHKRNEAGCHPAPCLPMDDCTAMGKHWVYTLMTAGSGGTVSCEQACAKKTSVGATCTAEEVGTDDNYLVDRLGFTCGKCSDNGYPYYHKSLAVDVFEGGTYDSKYHGQYPASSCMSVYQVITAKSTCENSCVNDIINVTAGTTFDQVVAHLSTMGFMAGTCHGNTTEYQHYIGEKKTAVWDQEGIADQQGNLNSADP